MTVASTADSSGLGLLKHLYALAVDNVSPEISPEDGMFEASREHYFSVGQSALRCIRLALLAAEKDRVQSILDFGCGFGRVLRVLKAAFPGAELVACDLSAAAIGFCASAFGASPLQSCEDVGEIKIAKTFDLIWCGTLLTNVDATQVRSMLRLFRQLLPRKGVLVFTTHGPFVARRILTGESTYGLPSSAIPGLLKDYESSGFGYVDYSAAVLTRLGMKKYGISVSRPSWVCREIESLGSLDLLAYTERGWDHHQDSVACIKTN